MVQILDDLGYKVYSKVLDAKNFGLPQTRRRVFMVCILKTYFQNNNNYVFPSPIELNSTVYDILDKHVEKSIFIKNTPNYISSWKWKILFKIRDWTRNC